MKQILAPLEARIIGCLIEKQITTPDQYPLSLNALTNACNQKSNRDPEMQLTESEVQAGVDALLLKSAIMEKSGFGSRVPKFQQRFCNTEFSDLKFTPQELAIVCELLLRGSQTPGELRTRTSRMAAFSDVSEVEAALESLARREPHALVVRLPRQTGRRDSCYAQLFTGEAATRANIEPGVAPMRESGPEVSESIEARLTRLEAEVRSLQIALYNLQQSRS